MQCFDRGCQERWGLGVRHGIRCVSSVHLFEVRDSDGGDKAELLLDFIPARRADELEQWQSSQPGLDAKSSSAYLVGYGVPLSHRQVYVGTGHEGIQPEHPGD